MMTILAGFFGYYWFNIEPNTQCFAKREQNTPIYPIPVGIDEVKETTDVSFDFDLIISMFFINSITGAFLGFYDVLSIYCVPKMLKFSQPVGIFAKLNMAFGAFCMIYLHISRLCHAGKVCSGDYLTSEELSGTASTEVDFS
jgi:hypothetical protein